MITSSLSNASSSGGGSGGGVTFGPVGISGVPSVTFGVAGVTFPQQSAIGITGPVSVTFGVASVTFPAFQGPIGITGPVAVTFGVVGVTFPQQSAIGITGPVSVVGNIANDDVDSGNPVKIGYRAKNYGSLPTAVADADRVNAIADRYGASYVQPGSSYVRTFNAEYSSAQTNVAMLTAGAGESIRVYQLVINLDYDAQAVTSIAIGFGTASTPTTDGVLFETNGMVPGTYVIPFPAACCGASGEDLRITCTDPTSGFLNVIILYDIISI